MNLQQMSGQISGQVPNQSGTSLPGLPQQSGNPYSMQMQNPVVPTDTPNMEPEVLKARRYITNKIYEHLMQRQQPHEKPPKKVIDIVKRLEEGLFKSAPSKEEYMNLTTLENRLHGLIKGLRMNNHNQRFSRVNSSGSIGTMIPTPGMGQSANSSLIGTQSVDSSMAAGNTIASSTVNSGSFLPMANVSSGPLANRYQQPTSNFLVNSDANNLVPSMSGQRMTSQMIPTPGFNTSGGANLNSNISAQSSMSLESSNFSAFSSVDSTIVSQPLQQKQHVTAQNSRILHTVGSHMGGGMRAGLQNRSYGQSTGPLNGGLGMIVNNLHLVNGIGASEGYISATTYGNSPKSLPRNFDQQHQPLMQGDRFGASHADTSGSGNVYLPVSSVGMVMNNQNQGALALQSMSKTNSPLITDQSNLTASQQMPNIKIQPVDHSAKMNFQSQHSLGDNHLSSYQQQHSQQQPPQFQEQHQLIQPQPQQKLLSQQHQLLSRSNAFAQAQLPSDLGVQVKSEPGNHDEALNNRVNSEQLQFSDINQFQASSVEDHSKGMSNANLNRICMDEDDPMLHMNVGCKHGELLPLCTSWSKKNLGRRCCSCPYYGDSSCKFFRWRDEEIDSRSKFVLPRLANKVKELEEGLAYFESQQNQWMDMTNCMDKGSKRVKEDKKNRNWCSLSFKVMMCIVVVVVLVLSINSHVKDGHCKCMQMELP